MALPLGCGDWETEAKGEGDMASWLGCPLIITLSQSESSDPVGHSLMGGGKGCRQGTTPGQCALMCGQGGAQKMRGLNRRQPSRSGEPSLASPPNPHLQQHFDLGAYERLLHLHNPSYTSQGLR